MARLLYTLALFALLPYVALHLLLRSRKQPEYLEHLGERFGRHDNGTKEDGPLIWLHAVSVGETRAAAPLVAALAARYPRHRILLTHMTPTGRRASEELFGDGVERVYLPYDYPFAVRRFLAHFRPQLGVILETELWPNLVAICRQEGIPLLLVNARLSEKSARRYARFPGLARGALEGLAAIAAQSEADADRLHALGAPQVEVLGNVKFDLPPPPAQLALGDALLVIVPRHPQRFEEVAALAQQRGFALQRRSEDAPVAARTQVLLGDSMGELFAYYAACDVAFVGGSLLDYGSQNLIEPCAVGRPVLIGRSTHNFSHAAREALACGAAKQIDTAEELLEAARGLLADAAARRRMGEAGREFAARHRGATEKTVALIERHLPALPG